MLHAGRHAARGAATGPIRATRPLEVDVVPDLELRLDGEEFGVGLRLNGLELLEPPLAPGCFAVCSTFMSATCAKPI